MCVSQIYVPQFHANVANMSRLRIQRGWVQLKLARATVRCQNLVPEGLTSVGALSSGASLTDTSGSLPNALRGISAMTVLMRPSKPLRSTCSHAAYMHSLPLRLFVTHHAQHASYTERTYRQVPRENCCKCARVVMHPIYVCAAHRFTCDGAVVPLE